MAGRLYLKLGDVEGSSGDEDHTNWIEVSSFSSGVSNSINVTEKVQDLPGGEACHHQDISLTK